MAEGPVIKRVSSLRSFIAEHPHTATTAIADWVKEELAFGNIADPEPGPMAVQEGEAGGWWSTDEGMPDRHFLLTHAALADCLARCLGLACSTVVLLHHVLADLVDLGLVGARVVLVKLPSGAVHPMYRVEGRIVKRASAECLARLASMGLAT